MSEEEDYEPSEEVRIKFLTLLVILYEKFPTECEPFLEDTLLILATSLEDKCPDIKKKAAGLVVTVSGGQGLTTRKVMRARGETLVAPLSRNISHRQVSGRKNFNDVTVIGTNVRVKCLFTNLARICGIFILFLQNKHHLRPPYGQ